MEALVILFGTWQERLWIPGEEILLATKAALDGMVLLSQSAIPHSGIQLT
jgi:hypothetical protein